MTWSSRFNRFLILLAIISTCHISSGQSPQYNNFPGEEMAEGSESHSLAPGSHQTAQPSEGEILCKYFHQALDTELMQSFRDLPTVNGFNGYEETLKTFSDMICAPGSPFHYSKIMRRSYCGGDPSQSRLIAHASGEGVIDIFAAYSSTLPGRSAEEFTYGVLCAMTDPELFVSALNGRYPKSLKRSTLLLVGPECGLDGLPSSFRTHMRGKNVFFLSGFQIEAEIRRLTIEAEGRKIQIVILAEAKELHLMNWMLQIKLGLTDTQGKSHGLVYNRVRIGTPFYEMALKKFTGSIDEEIQIIHETLPNEDPEQIKQTWKARMLSLRR